jgi:RNAse (barnase) inhibitor barstar
MYTLTFSGKTITSLTDIYDLVIRELHLEREKFGKNLDALYDVLVSSSLSKIVITENHLLKEHLSKIYKNEHTEYELFLDLLTDLE